MIAKAPGKLVISGAYAVLAGAPAIVSAVDRYAIADTSQSPPFVTAEVQAALSAGYLLQAPGFDASALRTPAGKDGSTRKLGLGSSAAILVASIAACSPALSLSAWFDQALAAHRTAQGGGSGVDVAASVFGGVLLCRLSSSNSLDVQPHSLPEGTRIHVFSSATASETSGMLKAVRAFATRDPGDYKALMARAIQASEQAALAQRPEMLCAALFDQQMALRELGQKAGAPIVPDALVDLVHRARREGASFGPSGAGGGDIAIFVSERAPSPAFAAAAQNAGLEPLDLQIAARGAHCPNGPDQTPKNTA